MSEVKFLGMYIMDNLSWQAQICSLCHSLNNTYYNMKPLQTIVRNHVLWNIYFPYFNRE